MKNQQHSHIYIHLLGSVQAEKDGQPVQGFESQKALALLGYLAAQGRPISRTHLTGLFWGEKPEKRARGNLRRVLHNLNQLLPNCLNTDRYAVQVLPSSACHIDIMAFDQLEQRADPAALTEAAALCSGDFMEGVSLNDCPEFDTWLRMEQERWRLRAAQVLDTLITHHHQRGQYASALQFAQRLLSLTPWQEGAHRQVMLLLSRSGQRSAALRQYQACCRMLTQEFGVDPAPETAALYARIRTAEARPRPNLPTPPTAFVGRRRELAEISQMLASPDCRLLTISGLGGIGKTRLVIQYAAQSGDIFLDGIAYVPLAAVDSSQHLVPAIAQTLRVSLAASPSPRAQIFAYLREKEILLVLDNCEHLLDGAVLLTEILNAAPQSKILVTSRERLNLRGEWVYPLEGMCIRADPLPHPQPFSHREMGVPLPLPVGEDRGEGREEAKHHPEAIALFLQRARQADFRFSPSADTYHCAAKICGLVEGVPLGIELAAALVPHLSCEVIRCQIQHNLDVLASPLRDVPARHRSPRAVFESSWNLLSDQEQQAFKQLSVFRGGCTLEAAAQVTGASQAVLTSLVDKSLLLRLPSGRYEMHAVLHQYAAEALARFPNEDRNVRAAHNKYFASILQKQEPVFRGHREILEEIADNIENIRRAWDWAVEQTDLSAWQQSVDTLGAFYDIRCWYQTGAEAFAQAVAILRPGAASDPDKQIMLAHLLGWQGEFVSNLGQYETAEAMLQEGLAIFRTQANEANIAWALLSLGIVAINTGLVSQAEEYYTESLSLFESIDEQNGAAICQEFLGTVFAIAGDYPQARLRYQKSLHIYQAVDDRYGIAEGLYCLGDITRILGDYPEARRLIEKSRDLYQTVGSPRGVAQAANQMGNICRLLGEYPNAKHHHEESLALHREIGEREGIATSLTNLGIDAYMTGDYSQAKAYCQKGLAIYEESGHRRGIIFAQIHLGNVQRALHEYQAAEEHLHAALTAAREIQATPQAMESLAGIAALLAQTGQKEQAVRWLADPLSNPATFREVRDQAQALLSELEAELTPDVVAAALEQGGKTLSVS